MKKVILDFQDLSDNFKELVQEAFNVNFYDFMVSEKTFDQFNNISQIIKYSMDTQLSTEYHIYENLEELYQILGKKKTPIPKIGFYIEINTNKDLNLAIELSRSKKIDLIIASAQDWKVIPFENLIAEISYKNTQLIAHVRDVNEAALMLKTLESGVDGVLISPKKVDDIVELKKLIQFNYKIKIDKAKVIDIQSISESERVCVDTTSLLNVGEGMLIGSTAMGFVLIHAEVFESQFISSRPFRVNAGDVSAYILVPSENSKEVYKTKYLSEIKGGDNVFVVDNLGNARVVSVGRVKIETRPMLRFVLEAIKEGKTIHISCICQNAETINFIDLNGKAKPVVNIKKGEEFLVHIGPGATHFGTIIKEKIIEK